MHAFDERLTVDYDGISEFLIDQAFHLDYLIKIQAQTFGTYSLELDPGLSFKICQIVLSHVGTNFPFMAMPGSSAQLNDNVVISWADPTTMFTCGNAVTISFEVRFSHLLPNSILCFTLPSIH